MQPPEVLQGADAQYPPEARRSARVILRLLVDAQGRVVELAISESGGPEFDAAALAAAASLRFRPAQRDGTSVSARILFPYVFEPPVPTAGTVTGTVTLPGRSGGPAVGAAVVLEGTDGAVVNTRTGVDGQFTLPDVPEGAYTLRVRAEGIGAAELPLSVAAGGTAKTWLRLVAAEADPPINVTVEGESEAEKLRRSAQAVTVVETERAQRESSDLGEVLARVEGVSVRRNAGLGSGARFSLNGLENDQIRFFLDGIPLNAAGFPFGIANVPVNLVERIEVYRGVVPIRFGADALGGAVNLVTDTGLQGTSADVSYQAGSFDTHRLTLGARHLDDATGLFVRGSGFLDSSENDYTVDVEFADTRPETRGRPVPIAARRFSDRYRAAGGRVEVGFVDRGWAERLILRGFVTHSFQDIQSDLNMNTPFGEVEQVRDTMGGTLQYRQTAFGDRLEVDFVVGLTRETREFLDVSPCIYSWLGQCLRERPENGEISPGAPRDDTLNETTALGRFVATWRFLPGQSLSLSIAPTYVARDGEDRLRDPSTTVVSSVDVVAAERDLLTVVSGLSHELNLIDGRLQNIAFVKNYTQYLRSEPAFSDDPADIDELDRVRWGFGDAVRFRLLPWLDLKASYEFATRLPNANEVFGDGGLTDSALELEPETSHNVNVGATARYQDEDTGEYRANINGFLRETENQIVLLPAFEFAFSNQNIFDARSVGVEAAAGWTSVGRYVSLDVNATYLDLRNLSEDGPFSNFLEDRVPNRPFFFINGLAEFALPNLLFDEDRLALTTRARFVEEFFEFWESAGTADSKRTVPDQIQLSAALTYGVERPVGSVNFTAEVLNITDERLFDFFGAQRPGRAVFFKVTGRL